MTVSRHPADNGRWSAYDGAIVVDALASPGPFNIPNRIGRPLSNEMVSNAAASGITAVNVTASGSGGTPDEAHARTLEHLAYWRREVEAHPDVPPSRSIPAASRTPSCARWPTRSASSAST